MSKQQNNKINEVKGQAPEDKANMQNGVPRVPKTNAKKSKGNNK